MAYIKDVQEKRDTQWTDAREAKRDTKIEQYNTDARES